MARTTWPIMLANLGLPDAQSELADLELTQRLGRRWMLSSGRPRSRCSSRLG